MKITFQESETIEFKSSFNEATIETLVAFANTKGGTVYIGVNDDATIQGIQIGNETIQKWLNEIKIKTQPSIITYRNNGPEPAILTAFVGRL